MRSNQFKNTAPELDFPVFAEAYSLMVLFITTTFLLLLKLHGA